MKTLNSIQLERGYMTDKADEAHTFDGKNYLHRYEPFFAARKDKPGAVLEIGLSFGGSHKLWRDYFSVGGIHAIDNRTELVKFSDELSGVNLHFGDQSDFVFCDSVGKSHGPFKVIVDDGSHHVSDIKSSLKSLWPHLLPGGIYAIEDLRLSHDWGERREFWEAVSPSIDSMDRFKGDISAIHFFPMLVVIEKCN